MYSVVRDLPHLRLPADDVALLGELEHVVGPAGRPHNQAALHPVNTASCQMPGWGLRLREYL